MGGMTIIMILNYKSQKNIIKNRDENLIVTLVPRFSRIEVSECPTPSQTTVTSLQCLYCFLKFCDVLPAFYLFIDSLT